MKKTRKIAAVLFSAAIAASALSTAAQAAPLEPPAAQSVDVGIQPCAVVIVTKYRAYQGLFQKRRWNETRGYWVDPEWITIGTQV